MKGIYLSNQATSRQTVTNNVANNAITGNHLRALTVTVSERSLLARAAGWRAGALSTRLSRCFKFSTLEA